MGKEWSSAVEAKAKGSLCNFQLPAVPSFSVPVPTFTMPDFPPELPEANPVCPLDEEDEEVPT